MNNLPFDFSSGVQGRSPGRGSGGRSPPVKSSYKQILRIFYSHTIYEIETLIIVDKNYEAQLQSANSVPIRTTFILHMKKWVKQLGPLMFMCPDCTNTVRSWGWVVHMHINWYIIILWTSWNNTTSCLIRAIITLWLFNVFEFISFWL